MPQTTIYASPRSVGAPQELPPAVATHELARLFGGNPALAGVTLTIPAGRCVQVVGPNGAGKTTLLRILATAIRPSFGSAAVDGLDVATHPELVRSRIAYLSHATGLYDDLTARENLEFAATMLGLDRGSSHERIRDALDEIGLNEMATLRVRGFSAGMRRRLALGRVLLARPSLVLLDEPFAALDADGIQRMEHLLDRWHRSGVTTLVASHATEHIAARADATVELEGGGVARVTGEGVIARPPNREPSAPRVIEVAP
ncbi:MAG: heme ABC exporter ATP-binding protein CcmA [Chloroflexi bacterium]|nr:MAG: heme ABC exporter ATP-binding protein CcmA [Chloroflexota bacterium]